MALTGPRYTGHSFFSNTPAMAEHAEKRSSKPTFVDVGGNGDCGFRAVAAGLIDNFLSHPHVKGEWLNRLLTQHFKYFPEQRTTPAGLWTPAERMQQLLKHVRMGELLQTLAYTLRQMAVTEMCAHPELYRGAFVGQHENTAPADMRQATTWIDESSIAALAHAIDLPIKVRVVESGKTLPMNLCYNEAKKAENPLIVIKLQQGHYVPRVHASERFKAVKDLPIVRPLNPVIENLPQDPELSEILTHIAAEDKRLVKAFEDTHYRLMTMVAAGELNKEGLLAIYTKNMGNSDYLKGRVAYVTTEHGNQDFFNAIFRSQQSLPQEDAGLSSNEQITAELVHALARAITIGQMNVDEVFAQIDDAQEVRPHRATA